MDAQTPVWGQGFLSKRRTGRDDDQRRTGKTATGLRDQSDGRSGQLTSRILAGRDRCLNMQMFLRSTIVHLTFTPLRIDTDWLLPPRSINGLDHLGSQAPCVLIYSQLLPGITNVTDRARYYSFYPWVTWSLDKRYP